MVTRILRTLVNAWRQWRDPALLSDSWWKERDRLASRVEFHGPVWKWPIRRPGTSRAPRLRRIA